MNFNSINEYHNYMPNCLVCGKDLEYKMSGYVWETKSEGKVVYFHFRYNDGVLSCKTKNHTISIDGETNSIIDGASIFTRLTDGTLNKQCTTCDLKISTQFMPPIVDKLTNLRLVSENLHYTLKGGRTCQITKWYSDSYENGYTQKIIIDKTWLHTNIEVELIKFKNKEHLNKRLATLLLLH